MSSAHLCFIQAAREAEATELYSVLDNLWELLEVPPDDLAKPCDLTGQAAEMKITL